MGHYIYASHYATSVNIDAGGSGSVHTALVELYYVPTYGPPQLKATSTVSFTTSRGYLVEAANNFDGGEY